MRTKIRTISLGPVAFFECIFLVTIALGIRTALWVLDPLALGDFRGISVVMASVAFTYLYAIGIFRALLARFPLPVGHVPAGSRAEFVTQVYFIFLVVLVNPVICPRIIPFSLTRYLYMALGTKMGPDTHCAGFILDPPLTVVGENTVIGFGAVLYAHAVEGSRYSFDPIRIGSNVTIGANAVIMSDVAIEDGAIIGAGSVVTKGTHIPADERWGGVPAKRLGAARADALRRRPAAARRRARSG
jgi:acetyltransferase-like isoleucine patch superfamily enzyme